MKNDSYYTFSDEYLVVLLRQGDDRAFTEIYDRYWEKLLFIGTAKLRDLNTVEELVQDIFLDMWNRRHDLDITSSLEGYLAVSMKYKVINAQVKQKRKLEYEKSIFSQQPEADHSTEQWLAFEDLKDQLEKLVQQLPEKCRITYQLSREHGLTQKQIARQLNVAEKSVESSLGRAIKTLRSLLNRSFFNFF